MNYRAPKLRQMLAAEYVAGTLVGAARRRFRRLLAEDPALRAEVRYWEARFGDLGIFEPVPPRAQVWAEIEQRVQAAPPGMEPVFEHRHRASITFWRLWAGFSTAACVLLAVLLLRQYAPPPSLPDPPKVVELKVQAQAYVAAIRLPDEDAQWTVSVLPDTRAVRVLANGNIKLGFNEDYELWWLGDDGVISLGLLPRQGAWQVALPPQVRVRPSGRIAVSLEPAGGSPAKDGPSGPVLIATPLVPSV